TEEREHTRHESTEYGFAERFDEAPPADSGQKETSPNPEEEPRERGRQRYMDSAERRTEKEPHGHGGGKSSISDADIFFPREEEEAEPTRGEATPPPREPSKHNAYEEESAKEPALSTKAEPAFDELEETDETHEEPEIVSGKGREETQEAILQSESEEEFM